MQTPDVSVVIPSYNRGYCIATAVRSVLAQRGVSLEIIVVDDGSTDSTQQVLTASFPGQVLEVSSLLDPLSDPLPHFSIRYTWKPNGGHCSANNTGLAMCRGHYVKFLDSDDELLPDSLAHEFLAARQLDVDVLCTGFEERFYFHGIEHVDSRCVNEAPNVFSGIDDLLAGKTIWTAAALYRRISIEHLSWPVHIHFATDWAWAWTVALAGATFGSIPIYSAVYKHHLDDRMTNASDSFDKSVVARQQILENVHSSLLRQGLLTNSRRRVLAQYFYKDCLTLREKSRSQLRALCDRCFQLDPSFTPLVYNPRLRPFVSLLGPFWGADCYVRLKYLLTKPILRHAAKLVLRILKRDYIVAG